MINGSASLYEEELGVCSGDRGLRMVLFNIFINEVGREARRDDN